MGDIARGRQRFVAGCTRCLRTALASIPTKYDDDERGETGRSRRPLRRRGGALGSPAVARALLAGSAVVAGSSRRLRSALAGIPLTDEDERAEQVVLRRLAMASPAVAGALFVGAVAASPAQAQTAPPSPAPTAPAPAPAQSPAPPPAPPPEPPLVTEYAVGFGVPSPWGPLGGELGMLVHPDGSVQLTGLGGWYAGGKISAEQRSARTPGVAAEAKAVGSAGNLGSAELVGQVNLNEALNGNFVWGDSWKYQAPFGAYYGGTLSGNNLDVNPRYGGQARLPSQAQPVRGIVGAAGIRGTTPPMTPQQVNDAYHSGMSPIDP